MRDQRESESLSFASVCEAVDETTMQAEQNTRDRRAHCPVSDEAVPTLDLGPFLAGEDGAAEKTATELRYALERLGFFILNHGVARTLRDRLLEQTAANTLIDCLPPCCGPDNPPQEPPIPCVDYLRWFMAENFALGARGYERPEPSEGSRERNRFKRPP